MKVFVTGTRGIPNIPGGVERHCQELYTRISAKGHSIIVCRRTPYTENKNVLKNYKGVVLLNAYCPRRKSLEAIFHTFVALIIARSKNPDILHIHAIGPSLLTPFARLLGLKVVTTNHGPDYNRGKWGSIAKKMLRLGEYLGGLFSHKTIAISSVIADIVRKRCGIEPVIIPNGVKIDNDPAESSLLEKINVKPYGYILSVARLVPEKGLHDLLDAFAQIEDDIQLVIAGDADHESEYSRKIKLRASQDKRIIMTGYITGELLKSVFAYAKLFVFPSHHEGHPIALLEALAYGLPVLVSDIPAHKELGFVSKNYFKCGDINSLTYGIRKLLKDGTTQKDRKINKQVVESKYNWDRIAEQTIAVYKEVLKN